MTAHPSRGARDAHAVLLDVIDLLRTYQADAERTVQGYDLTDPKRSPRASYHEGRADAFDAAVSLVQRIDQSEQR